MRILFVSPGTPAHDIVDSRQNAVHIQAYQTIISLRRIGYDVILQIVFESDRTKTALEKFEEELIAGLSSDGITVLEPLFVSDKMSDTPVSAISKIGSHIRHTLGIWFYKEIYPSVAIAPYLAERFTTNSCDVILPFVCAEALGALQGGARIPCVAFEGNVHFAPAKVVHDHADELFVYNGKGVRDRLSRFRNSLHLKAWKRKYRTAIMQADHVAYTSYADCLYARSIGHPNAEYVGTTWTDPEANDPGFTFPAARNLNAGESAKIIAHVGSLGNTANTFALMYLLEQVMPAIEAKLEGIAYEVHVIGGGTPTNRVEDLLNNSRTIRRGFVEDLDSEMLSCDVFLFLNHQGPLLSIFSRPIYAWSLGLCMVAHANGTEALPELSHQENVLLGKTPNEIATAVHAAISNPDLNQCLRNGGRQTYLENFTPCCLTQHIAKILQTYEKTEYDR